jgi:transposase
MRGDSRISSGHCTAGRCPAGKFRGPAVVLGRRRKKRLDRTRRKLKDAALARRYQIVLLRAQDWTYRKIAEAAGASVSTVRTVLQRWSELGEAGLVDRREDNGDPKVTEEFLKALWRVLERTAPEYGWPQTTWNIHRLCETLGQKTGVWVSRSTMGRALQQIGARKGRPKPTVGCPWSPQKKARRLNELRRLQEGLGPREVAVWEDEVDIHLNPKIGPDWMLPNQQRTVLTPGKNEKRYVAGALDSRRGQLTWVTGKRKSSPLFLQLLLRLCEVYRWAKVIHVFLDNFKIHDSQQTRKMLAQLGGKVQLHFLPPYCPDENPIERFWRDLHENVTRNHRHRRMAGLMRAVERYLQWRNAEAGATRRKHHAA